MDNHYFLYRDIFKGQPLPLAFIDMDLLDENIRRVKTLAHEKNIRVASKSIRCEYILHYILGQGTPFRGLMTYHPKETLRLSLSGFDDLLIGYPTLQKNWIEKLADEIAAGKQIRFMADSEAHLAVLNAVAGTKGIRIPVCMDVDMSVRFPGLYFGVYRSPLKTTSDVSAFLKKAAAMPHITVDAMMGYEAQVAGVGDRIPGAGLKNGIVRWLKKRSQKIISHRRQEYLHICRNEGLHMQVVNGGGTGSLKSTGLENGITEITVGSGFYAPALFDYYRDYRWKAATGFALEICRIPEPGMVTCHMGGYIASGTTGIIKQPLPYLPAGLHFIKNEGAGEVQTPLKYHGDIALSAGDPVFFRHAKAGELMAHFPHVYLLRNGKIEQVTDTYRLTLP